MPKRKSGAGDTATLPTPSLASLDAALDLLACEIFGRLDALAAKFEAAAGVKLNDGVIMSRWNEATRRFQLMKSMDDLTCSGSRAKQEEHADGEVAMDDGDGQMTNGARRDSKGYERPMPKAHHPGAAVAFELDRDEEAAWRSWSPHVNDLVLVQLEDGCIWPGKLVDKKHIFQGRSSIPRGNHFHAVRIYNEDIEPTLTVKSRLIPLHLRPSAPLLASTSLVSAYNHANNPTSFDMLAASRESAAAHARIHAHPSVGDDAGQEKLKAQKEEWKNFVNWLMNERRVEKLRALSEEREKKLKAVTRSTSTTDDDCNGCAPEDDNPRKRRVTATLPPFSYKSSVTVEKVETNQNERGGIFRVSPNTAPSSTLTTPSASSSRASTPMAAYIRPALSATVPHRAGSPRRADRRRAAPLNGVGDFSPRGGRGSTYTPPRVLPSGDETAPYTPSPAPSLRSFDFSSPISKHARAALAAADDDIVMTPKNSSTGSSLEAVLEEEGEEGTWTVVLSKRSKRAGSEPCEKAKEVVPRNMGIASDDLVL